ncbi:ATP-binding cassette domain-containing protein [Roseospira marina]|uniref:ATP-binding cassette domain-containing protein n=1 Tax=Roseospira marina TaxID=140057 RepID=A0A5M6IFS9_9PROT|nr:ATP-binding cassette domain-containing protein [Roseospira marina]KAA5606438.1 ATP-binding cassette domain-containing protein [Roseospira marina]MBB4314147.1 putative ABC transport system ATP-binding protein [Roseospira marina]MBB5087308.1 putative ABC transport system ATP-binding protein [Roseospira marina]
MGLSLRVEGLEVPGPDGRVLLRLDTLSLPAGARLGVRGPSGAGKSTFLYAIAGLMHGARGRVAWEDTDLLSLRTEARTRFRAETIGMIFQDFLLFDELGPMANATLTAMFHPRRRRAPLRARAASLLEQLGLPETPRPVATFSGGERQRVAVARALAADAPVLLADEPTASLHREAADRLIDDLAELARARGTTLVAVSHDPALLERMDQVITLQDGGLVPEDTVGAARTARETA